MEDLILDSKTRTRNHLWIPVTDHVGRLLLPAEETHEPLPGSILMTEGEHGTAWQRHFSDGYWHSTVGGRRRTWDELIRRRNVVLVYDAPARVDWNDREV